MYNRLPRYSSTISGTENYSIFDDAMWSGLTNQDLEIRNNLPEYAYDRWRYWDYTLIRDIHVALDQINAANSPAMTTAVKSQFIAEFRFLRAMVYFELVKRMGGVPLVTTQLIYQLMPYTYTLAWEATTLGLPLMRSIWLYYPHDNTATKMGDQFFWGRDLLIAPVYEKASTKRQVYLPQGDWYDWWTNEKHWVSNYFQAGRYFSYAYLCKSRRYHTG